MKPYFLGQEDPPHPRLTSCQKCFRTTDIDQVGLTARHLTFFEMLGNFSFGDYFKQGAVEYAWELSPRASGSIPSGSGSPSSRATRSSASGPTRRRSSAGARSACPTSASCLLPRSDNFWQAGPVGPCGPCSELYFDRGLDFGGADDRPAATPSGSSSSGTSSSCRACSTRTARSPAAEANIDTGAGLDRLAAILQDVPSVYENDQFRPLVELGEELSGRRYGSDAAATRALRVLADHSRAMTFLIADGVVPSNEDRGYILRRVMRRAIQQGRSIGLDTISNLIVDQTSRTRPRSPQPGSRSAPRATRASSPARPTPTVGDRRGARGLRAARARRCSSPT